MVQLHVVEDLVDLVVREVVELLERVHEFLGLRVVGKQMVVDFQQGLE